MTFQQILMETGGLAPRNCQPRRRSWTRSYLDVTLSTHGDLVIKYFMDGVSRRDLFGIRGVGQLLSGNDWETKDDFDKRVVQREERIRKLRKGVFVTHEACNIRCVVIRKYTELVEIQPAPYEDDEGDNCFGGGCTLFVGDDRLNLVEHIES